jgi:UDP-GlcNAc:undecaprenyl-phosphate/decaprenyl-phosphate GlcNAc-1-phosphate transferase
VNDLTWVVLVALASAIALTPVAIRVASKTGFVDRPGALKSQTAPVPLLGGAAVFLATLSGIAVGRPIAVAPLLGALFLGILDDRFDLPPWVRLLGQAAVGVAIASIVTIHAAGFGGRVVVVAGAMVLMNGVNFLDGLDGLASGVTLLAGLGFAVLLEDGSRDLAAALCAALAGFLLYNVAPARIYLGDGGAYFIGATLALLATSACSFSFTAPRAMASALLLALPVAEVTVAVLRRARARSRVVHGDRRHPYDLLVARGWTPSMAALAYFSTQMLLTVAAIAVWNVDVLPGAVLVAVCVAGLVTLAKLSGSLAPQRH